MVAADKIFGVMGDVRVALIPIPVSIEKPSCAVIAHIIVDAVMSGDIAGHRIEVVIPRKKSAFDVKKGSLAEDVGEAETAHEFRRFLLDGSFNRDCRAGRPIDAVVGVQFGPQREVRASSKLRCELQKASRLLVIAGIRKSGRPVLGPVVLQSQVKPNLVPGNGSPQVSSSIKQCGNW